MLKKPNPLAALSRAFRLISLMIVTVATSACSSLPVDSGCKSFGPISWSKQDTDPTKKQIVAHNRAYDAICPKPKLTASNYP
jgi:hypothetical protein